MKVLIKFVVVLFVLSLNLSAALALSSVDFQVNDLTEFPVSDRSTSADYGSDTYPADVIITYTLPAVTLSGVPSSPTTSTSATITVSGPAGITEYLYRIDGGPTLGPFPIATTISLTGLATGAHTLDVVGGDGLGNFRDIDTEATSATWTVTSGGGGGGGGGGGSSGGGSLDAPTIDVNTNRPVYLSVWPIDGTRSSGSTVLLNGSESGVSYPNDTTWEVTRALKLTDNTLEVQAVKGSSTSDKVVKLIHRRLVGDTDQNGFVDDFDLAAVAAHWGDSSYWQADFNHDGFVDDFDLSGLATHWWEDIRYLY